VIRFARNGKIVRHVLEIVVLALIQLSVEMRHVTARKPATRVHRIVATVLHQDLYAVTLYAKAQTEKIVNLALAIAANVSHTVEMGHANIITMRTASCALVTADPVPHPLIQSVAMEHAIQMKIVLLAPATVRVLVSSHRVLKGKCAMIQMSV
jgi:hypothetical protein